MAAFPGGLAARGRVARAASSGVRRTILLLSLLAAALWLLPPPVGTAPARAPASPPPVPQRARFVPIASFDSLSLIGPGAWSPRGQRLALRCSTGTLVVFDAARPTAAPWVVLRSDQWIQSVSWSPDGSWLAAALGDPGPRQPTAIVAVAARHGTPAVMIRGTDLRPVAWGCDGRVYCWTGRRRHAMDPPAAWTPPAALRRANPPVVEVADDLSLRLRHWAPQPGEALLLQGADLTSANGTRLTVLDLLPDQSRALVGVSRDSTALWLIVDGDGRTLTDLRRQGLAFQPTSLSGDGRLVAGFTGRWQSGQGWTATALRVADARGAWVLPIEGSGGGMAPQLARAGTLLAFTDPPSGATRVGRLLFEPR